MRESEVNNVSTAGLEDRLGLRVLSSLLPEAEGWQPLEFQARESPDDPHGAEPTPPGGTVTRETAKPLPYC